MRQVIVDASRVRKTACAIARRSAKASLAQQQPALRHLTRVCAGRTRFDHHKLPGGSPGVACCPVKEISAWRVLCSGARPGQAGRRQIRTCRNL
jgi:hypothetical protein